MFERLHAARHADMFIAERTNTALKIWVGDCCSSCNDSWVVAFNDVSIVQGLDDDTELDDPRFRYATTAEIEEEGLVVSAGAQAYRIDTTDYSDEARASGFFVVAVSVEIEFRPAGSIVPI